MTKIHYLNPKSEASSRETSVGFFSLLVMLAIMTLGKDAYGLRITEFLISKLEFLVDPGQVYLTLKRLEGRGMVKSRDAPSRGPSVKVYRLTETGTAAVAASLRYAHVAVHLHGELNGKESARLRGHRHA